MSRLLPYVLIAVIVTAHGPAAWAQGRPGEPEARKEAARRTREIMEMRRRMAEKARVREREIIRLHTEGNSLTRPRVICIGGQNPVEAGPSRRSPIGTQPLEPGTVSQVT